MKQSVEFMIESIKLMREFDKKINKSMNMLSNELKSELEKQGISIKVETIFPINDFNYGIKIGTKEIRFTIKDIIKMIENNKPHNVDVRDYSKEISENLLADLIGYRVNDFINDFLL